MALLHLGLGAALLHGLAGEPLRRSVDALTTFDVPPPGPPPLPEQPREDQQMAEVPEEGATDLAARPAPVVQSPVIPLPPPTLRIADEAAPVTGTAPDAGAGLHAGDGAGAGGSGAGTGGGGSGGSGAGGGFGSEARLLSGNLSRGDYRRIRGFGAPRGSAVLAIEVGASGQLTRCQPFTSSGNPALDGELCRLLGRTRWEPARDRGGNPVPVALRYVASWSRD